MAQKKEKKVVMVHSRTLDVGGYPKDCPFDSTRAGKTVDLVDNLGFLGYSNTKVVEPVAVSRHLIEQFHKSDYIDVLEKAGNGEFDYRALAMGLGIVDCPVFENMYEYLRLAVGGTTTGAKLILDGKADIVFNPSGGFHHAKPGLASGFCYINDVVLSANLFLEQGKRVAILDLDAHHFDGVQDAFYQRNDVLAVSIHESGKTLFPGTGDVDEIGKGDGLGFTVNIPLPVGTYDSIYRFSFLEGICPVLTKFNPDVIILELGMDALAQDPLAHLGITNNCYADIVADVLEFNKPILAVGGGGYNAGDTVRGWALMWNIFVNGREDELMAAAGMGGVMLENTAWFGGLRDKTLITHGGYRKKVDDEIKAMVHQIEKTVFPIHGIKPKLK